MGFDFMFWFGIGPRVQLVEVPCEPFKPLGMKVVTEFKTSVSNDA